MGTLAELLRISEVQLYSVLAAPHAHVLDSGPPDPAGWWDLRSRVARHSSPRTKDGCSRYCSPPSNCRYDHMDVACRCEGRDAASKAASSRIKMQ